MYILLLMLVFSLVCGSDLPQHVQHVEEITGDWRTIAMAADNVTEIEEDGPRRAYVSAIHCDKGCETFHFCFYTKVPGNNVFEIIPQSSNFMVIYAIYVEDIILNMHLTLALEMQKDITHIDSVEKCENAIYTYRSVSRTNVSDSEYRDAHGRNWCRSDVMPFDRDFRDGSSQFL
ncbi:Aphrodisin [Fukomys damarensis]|uniref:Aphrodisin n=1 Tax=Fukomys damarensis TaxID=885580 RepID=A0A091EN86_FUKDA|nr:Aphrodisin [Fukomys damarensis]